MATAFEHAVQVGGHVRRIKGPNAQHGLRSDECVDYCYRRGKTYRGPVRPLTYGDLFLLTGNRGADRVDPVWRRASLARRAGNPRTLRGPRDGG